METPIQKPAIYQTLNLTLLMGLSGFLCLWPNEYLAIFTSALLIGAIIVQAFKNRAWPPFLLVAYLFIFMGAASVGVWAAYATPQALTKFWILGTASLLAIYISQIQDHIPKVTLLLATSAIVFSFAFLAILFLDIDQGELLTPNRLAGLIGLLTPFLIFAYLKAEFPVQKYLYAAGGGIITLALIASGSRGGIAALLIGFGFWKILTLGKRMSQKLQVTIIGASLGFLVAIGTAGLMYSQQLESSLFNLIPGSGSRLTLYTNLKNLIPDYWILGGGLNSFSGHYSQYVLSIPHLKFTYGHHLYLDLILEQGFIGLAVFALLIGSSFIILLTTIRIDGRGRDDLHLSGAILASLTALVLHGFIDDAIYSNASSTMLFIAPALALSSNKNRYSQRAPNIFNLVALPVLIGTAFILTPSIRSVWHSNIGAIEMAQIQLADWPTGEWSKGESAIALSELKPRFEMALEQNSENISAEYRLGLLKIEKHDFPAAVPHLAKAYKLNNSHLGIRKSLGYSYLWSGEPKKAEEMLKGIEGIHNELEAYRWWWQKLGKHELSEIAHNAHQSGMGLTDN